MRHFSLYDLRVFEREFERFDHKIVNEIKRSKDVFFIVFRNSDYALKFYSSFPGYRLVHVPKNQVIGDSILNDLTPSKVVKAKILNGDRVFAIWFNNRNSDYAFIFELIGSLSNFYVINDNGKVVYVGRRVKDKRKLRPGSMYTLPEKRVVKLDSIIDIIQLDDIKEGYICKNDSGIEFHIEKPSNCNNLLVFKPYSYALERFYSELYPEKEKIYVNSEEILNQIEVLEAHFPPDYTFETSFVEVDGVKIPVEEGVKCSKLVGKLRAKIKALNRPPLGKKETLSGVSVYESPSGKKVFVGRSAESNQRITFMLAKKKDLVFHVANFPGAHVLLCYDGSPFTEEDVQFCAKLAVKFSKVGGGKCEVRYSPVSEVFRKRGMPKGTFLFRNFKSIMVEK